MSAGEGWRSSELRIAAGKSIRQSVLLGSSSVWSRIFGEGLATEQAEPTPL